MTFQAKGDRLTTSGIEQDRTSQFEAAYSLGNRLTKFTKKSETDREKEPTRTMWTVGSRINWQKLGAIHACD
jgi:hypothetical protein